VTMDEYDSGSRSGIMQMHLKDFLVYGV
jgi:hypothetical protein